MPEVKLSQGTIRYSEVGEGPPVVFVHGVMVNGDVWGPLTAVLSREARCIVPDLPLGSHPVAMNDGADLSPPGLARLIGELVEALELDDVTLVGNDTGGALCQLVAAAQPEWLARLVLTNCDSFENFPPPIFAPMIKAMLKPGVLALVAQVARVRALRQRSMSKMNLTIHPIPDSMVRSWVGPLQERGIRRDYTKVLRGLDSKYTLEAAERLREFHRPALLAWGTQDVFFPLSDAERLADTLPDVRLERIENARTFVQLDAPERLAELIGAFARAPAAR
jgi:pimeloyl-ACP methyl ester carboxylesterase